MVSEAFERERSVETNSVFSVDLDNMDSEMLKQE